MSKRLYWSSCAAAALLLAAGSALAQDPGHPRVNEVDQRLDNQNARIQHDVATGQMSAAQGARDERHDANIAARARADEARNGGHLTAGEQHRLNQSLNRNNGRMDRQMNVDRSR